MQNTCSVLRQLLVIRMFQCRTDVGFCIAKRPAADWAAGLMLVLLYGREGWFSPVLRAAGFNVVFAFPGACTPSLQY